MYMTKGFTLIELLAVIVILAVLALIATPIVLNIIDDSKKNATLRSSENYIKAIEFSIAKSVMENKRLSDGTYPIMTSGSICLGTLTGSNCSDELVVEVAGETPESGNITIKSRKIDSYEFTYASGFVVANGEINGGEVPEPKTFSEDSWATIAANVRAGNLSKYNVGDTKTITLNGFGTHTVRIANTSTPSECSNPDFSQTACGFVIEFADIITDYHMNEYYDEENDIGTNEGGWEDSDMRNYVNSTILNSFPSDLKDLIIDTKVVSGYSEEWDSSNFVTTDKLYLLATGEIWENGENNIIENDTARDLTRQLDYYKGVTTDEGYVKATKDDSLWWLRSAYSYSTDTFYFVNDIGDWSNFPTINTYGVSVAFRL